MTLVHPTISRNCSKSASDNHKEFPVLVAFWLDCSSEDLMLEFDLPSGDEKQEFRDEKLAPQYLNPLINRINVQCGILLPFQELIRV
jgi:hypothetical protein